MCKLGRKLAAICLVSLSLHSALIAQEKDGEKVTGQKYALLIGVRQYDKTELEPLPFTEADVRDLATVLKDAGYDSVVLMTQTVGAEETRYLPTAENIRRELKLLLGELGESDSILVALAGHGVEFRGSEEVYFCPADAKPSSKGNLVAFSDIYKELETCQAGFKLLLVDACRKDPVANATRRATVSVESVTRPQRRVPPGGVAALFSCSSGEFAHESKLLKHGVFFHYVIEGLRGQADLDGDKKITLPELELYTKKNVPAKVREEFANRQMPDLIGKTRGLSPLTTVETAESLAEQGKELLDRGEYVRAISRFDAALRKDPKNAWVYFQRGYASHENGDYDRAIADYTESLRLNPDDGAAYNNRGLAHYYKDEHDLAIADFTRALRLDSKDTLALQNRGNAYRQRGDHDLALADYNAALTLEPENVGVLLDRGHAYRLHKDLAKARRDFDRAIKLDPDNELAWSNRGHLLSDLDEVDNAIADFTQAIRLNADEPEYLQNRGWLYLNKKLQFAKALDDYSAWVRLDPDSADALRGKVSCLARLGRGEEALRLCEELQKRDPEDGHNHCSRGEALFYLAKFAEAEIAFEKAVARFSRPDASDEDQAHAHLNRYNLANTLLEKGEIAKAEKLFRTLIEANAEDADSLNDLAYLLIEQGRQLDEAEQLIRRAMAVDRKKHEAAGRTGKIPADVLHTANLGWCLAKRGSVTEGLALLEQVARADRTQTAQFFNVLGDVHHLAGQPEEAKQAWKKALAVARADAVDQRRRAEAEKKLAGVK
jgi:tetratricopeptide (TPR) repeat protein